MKKSLIKISKFLHKNNFLVELKNKISNSIKYFKELEQSFNFITCQSNEIKLNLCIKITFIIILNRIINSVNQFCSVEKIKQLSND